MTKPLEPCRASINGKFCEGQPRDVKEGLLACSNPLCFGLFAMCDDVVWNTLQRDRLDAARWRELCKRINDGEGRFTDEDSEEIHWPTAVNIIDLAIQPPKGEKEGT